MYGDAEEAAFDEEDLVIEDYDDRWYTLSKGGLVGLLKRCFRFTTSEGILVIALKSSIFSLSAALIPVTNVGSAFLPLPIKAILNLIVMKIRLIVLLRANSKAKHFI